MRTIKLIFTGISLITILIPGFTFAQSVPAFEWVRQYGTAGADVSRAVDALGFNYMAGYTNGAFPGYSNLGANDAYVAKFDEDGNMIWARQFGTSGNDYGYGVAADLTGVYVIGFTTATLPGQISAGGNDVYIKKYDPEGNELWTKQFGTSLSDQTIDAITVDATGVYMGGTTQGTFPGNTNFGGTDYFIAKFSSDGVQQWIVQKGTTGSDNCSGIITDESGVFRSGITNVSGNNDGVLTKLNHAGIELWTALISTSGEDYTNDVFVDEAGIYLSGHTSGTFPGQSNAGGTYDAWVAKYDQSGSRLWLKEFGTPGIDIASAVSANVSGVLVSGYTDGALPGQTSMGSYDFYLMKYNHTGGLVWTYQTGTSSQDYIYLHSSKDSYVYVTGFTNGTFPGEINLPGSDSFLMKLKINDPPVADCEADQVKIITEIAQLDGSGSTDTDGDGLTYAWSVLSRPSGSTAQLSDPNIVNPTFEADLPGIYVIQLVVNDGIVESDPCTVTITVLTPQEATQELIADVQELVTGGVLNQGQGNALIVKLQAAIQNMNKGNYKAAINNLNAFINQVNAFYNAGILNAEQASILISAANRIIDVLEKFMTKEGMIIQPSDPAASENILTWPSPNPCISSTTIHYTLSMEEHVMLTVYNSAGKEVARLVNGMQGTGSHKVQLSTDALPGGMYFYRLQAGGFTATKKLVILK